MITRSKLVEQLRDYQVRSQHKCPPLAVFSPKPLLSTWSDVALAGFWALIFIVLLVSSYVTLYLKHYWLSLAILCIGILLPIRLRILRQSLARKRDKRLLLPLSMWISSIMAEHLRMFTCSKIGFFSCILGEAQGFNIINIPVVRNMECLSFDHLSHPHAEGICRSN